jgi:hypothetical protein
MRTYKDKSQLADRIQTVNTDSIEINQIQRNLQISTDLEPVRESSVVKNQSHTTLTTHRWRQIQQHRINLSTPHHHNTTSSPPITTTTSSQHQQPTTISARPTTTTLRSALKHHNRQKTPTASSGQKHHHHC